MNKGEQEGLKYRTCCNKCRLQVGICQGHLIYAAFPGESKTMAPMQPTCITTLNGPRCTAL
jgi:hypothetical protein